MLVSVGGWVKPRARGAAGGIGSVEKSSDLIRDSNFGSDYFVAVCSLQYKLPITSILGSFEE